jgi:hypothetical protein
VHRSVKLLMYGLMFMGTPHQVGSGVVLGRLTDNVALVFVKQTTSCCSSGRAIRTH